MRPDVLDRRHPLTAFVFFAVLIICPVTMFHPAVCALSLAGALAYGIFLRGKKALRYFACVPLVIALIAALINVLFVHRGVTVIGTVFGQPMTLEALVYGACAGLMTAAVLMWFWDASVVMTSDKFICLFGRTAPSAALMFSMTMRFVPRYARQASRIREARRAMGCSDGEKVRGGLKTLSIMTTWALENSIVTADSMRARAYGTGKRSSYTPYRFRTGDAVLIAFAAAAFILAAAGGAGITCYPIIRITGSAYSLAAAGALSFAPVIMDITEDIRWRSYRSGI